MTTKVTEETRKEKKSTPEKMLGWFILAPILLIAVAIIIAAWPEDSDKEVRETTPAVAKRVTTISYLPTYGCGKSIRVVAPVGRWSVEIPERLGCDISGVKDPLPNASTARRLKNFNGLLKIRINGEGGPIKKEGRLPNGQRVEAKFEVVGHSVAVQSGEIYPIDVIVQFIPK